MFIGVSDTKRFWLLSSHTKPFDQRNLYHCDTNYCNTEETGTISQAKPFSTPF